MMTITAIFVFLLLFGVFRAVLWLRALRSIFAGRIRIDFMHADGFGGLREAGRICMTFNYVLFALAVTLGLFVYTDLFVFRNPDSARILIMAPAYFIVTPLAFFYSLYPIHRAMIRERDRQLKIVSERANRLFEQLQTQSIDTEEEGKRLHARVGVMKDLQEMHAWIGRSPRWPIDISMYIRFALSLLLPLVSYAVQLVGTDLLSSVLS